MSVVKTALSGMALAAALLAPVAASAAEGYATANVNMRSGPSTRYPAVVVIPVGASVEIHGCLADANWCDVSFYRGRGWVSGSYVQAVYQRNRVYLAPQYYRPLGIPTVTFELGNYWDRNYRNRDFYRDRDYWRDGNRRDYIVRDRDRDRDRFEPGRDRPRPDWDRGRDRPRFDDRDRNDGNDRPDRGRPDRRNIDRNDIDRGGIDRGGIDRPVRDRGDVNARERARENRDENRRGMDRREQIERRDMQRERNRDNNPDIRRRGCAPGDPSCDAR